MSSEGDKKVPGGWRVKVKNVIKVVSSNRKPSSKIRSEAYSVKSPKFHVSDWTSSESEKKKFESGELMMLEVAATKFGIKPLRKKFKGQKLLIYTLPNENNSLRQVPVENLVKLTEEKLKLETLKCNKNQIDIVEDSKISTLTTAYADSDEMPKMETTIAEVSESPTFGTMTADGSEVPKIGAIIADGSEVPKIMTINSEANETGDKITNQQTPIPHPDGKEKPITISVDGRPEPGKEGYCSVSLFSSPLPLEEPSAKGMYFGPDSISMQLDVN